MTTRRAFIGTVAGGLLAAPLAAEALQAAKIPTMRYAHLSTQHLRSSMERIEGLIGRPNGT